MKALVTGADGFVGRWLVAHLQEMGDDVVCPVADVTDADAIGGAIADAAPDAVYHLAALTHVGDSWSDPAQTFVVNALGTLRVLEASRALRSPPTVLVVSSAEVYGGSRDGEPLEESAEMRPTTPYAASKAAAELVALQAHLGAGLPVVRVRPFNHIGPGQHESFVVPGLARRIVAAQRSRASSVPVGNLEARRDFTDVRDVVRAHRLLVERGEPGEVYNVCSGEAVAISDIAERLLALAGIDLELVPDPSLVRPVEVAVQVGSGTKTKEITGWEPVISLDASLQAVLDEAATSG